MVSNGNGEIFAKEYDLASAKDYTCVCILDGFKNENAAKSMERSLKNVAEAKATEMMKVSRDNLTAGLCNLSLALDKEASSAVIHFCERLL